MPIKMIDNASLQAHNTMAVPALASHLAQVESLSELHSALAFANSNRLSVLVLGEGSNILFTKNFPGLVILNRLTGIELIENREKSVLIKIASGEKWHDLVTYSLQQSWYGLENLALIPGLVGAAPIQNIGAYGVELKDSFVSLNYLDIQSGKMISLDREQCQFAYRDSIFRNALASQGVITSVTVELSKIANVNLNYPALGDHFADQAQPTPQQVYDAVCAIRSSKIPLPSEVPNTGSFFKNPVVDHQQHRQLKAKHPLLVSYAVGENFKLAAGWLIEQAGWKNKTMEQVRVHREQALVITNPKRVSGAFVIKFAQAIQADVSDKFGVNLEIEPQLL